MNTTLNEPVIAVQGGVCISKQAVIAVHGGAWAIPSKQWVPCIDGVKKAVIAGYKILIGGGSAVDAVESAVKVLEDDKTFNAGTGSVLTFDEQVEMDALIMDGRNLNAGSVGAIKNVKNPISIARLVMEKTPHVLLVGDGANKFALSHGIKEVHPDILVTEESKNKLAKYKKFNTTIHSLFNSSDSSNVKAEHDTVGCIALDYEGHVASGTSTGGITAKFPGRVGDSPIVGAGGMADDEIGAASSTGHGEALIKSCLAKTILNYISIGKSTSEALKLSLDHMQRRIGGYGGAIALSASGDVATDFSTEKMAWAFIKENKLHYGLHIGEHIIEDIPS